MGQPGHLQNTVEGTIDIGGTVVGGTNGQQLEIGNTGLLRSVAAFIDVKAYGATGNGTTDDSTAIQNAINAIPAAGGILFFPPGTYKFATALTTGTAIDFTIRGAGKNATLLNYTGSGIGLKIGTIAGALSNSHIILRDFTISTGTGTKALQLVQIQDFFLENMQFIATVGTGIEFLGSNSGVLINIDARGCTIGADYVVSGSYNSNLIYWCGGQLTNNATAVRALGLSTENRISGCNISANTASPTINIDQGLDWIIDGNDFETNAGGASTYTIQLGVTTGGSCCKVINNYFNESNSVTYGVRIVKGEGTLVMGNMAYAGLTALVRCETASVKTVAAFNNSFNGGIPILSDASTTQDTLGSNVGNQWLIKDGSVSSPGIGFNAVNNTGFYRVSGVIGVAIAGVLKTYFGASGIATDQILMSSSTGDLVIDRTAAGISRIGNGTQYAKVGWDGTNALFSTTAGQIAFATAAKAAGDTTGYLTIPSSAGAPTGTPASIPTGQIPYQIDSTNKKLYAWLGGAWTKAQVSGVDVIFG